QSGSVSAKPPRNSPVAKRGRKFSFCCGVPKRSTAAAMIRCELKMPAKDIHTLETRSTTYAKIVERVSRVWMSLAGIFNSHLIMAADTEQDTLILDSLGRFLDREVK